MAVDKTPALVALFYNFERDAAVKGYEEAQNELQAQLNDMAENYPDIKSVMQKEGLMNPDGSIDPSKFIDSKLLETLKSRVSESETKQVGALLKNARANQALRGIGGSNIQTAGLAGQLNETSRGLNRDYGDAVNRERKAATGMAVNFGEKYQGDAMGKQNAKANALRSDAAIKLDRMNAQSAGLLQDPDAMGALVQTGLGLATGNPMMAAGGIGNALGGGSTGGRPNPIQGPQQQQTEYAPSGRPRKQKNLEDTGNRLPPNYYLQNP